MSEDSSQQQSGTAGVRASDEDRERLASDLREHAVAGRLETDELEQRLEAAYAARTTTELDALRRDLPATRREADLSHAARRSHLTRRMIQESGGSVILFVVCTAIWVLSGAHGQFWPAWVLVIVMLTLARNAWALFGPAADLESFERRLDHQRGRRMDRAARRLDRSDRRDRRRGG